MIRVSKLGHGTKRLTIEFSRRARISLSNNEKTLVVADKPATPGLYNWVTIDELLSAEWGGGNEQRGSQNERLI